MKNNFFTDYSDIQKIKDRDLDNILKGGGNLSNILANNYQNYTNPIFNQRTDIFLTLAGFKWCVVHPNGKIYTSSWNGIHIYEIDIYNNAFSSFPISSITSRDLNYGSAVLHPNGKIYAVPGYQDYILEIDVNNKITRHVGPLITDKLENSFEQSVYSPVTNKIYAIPRYSGGTINRIMEFDVNTEEMNFFGPILEYRNYNNLSLHPNGKIYAIQDNSALATENDWFLLEIDPKNKTVNKIPSWALNPDNDITIRINYTKLIYHPITKKFYLLNWSNSDNDGDSIIIITPGFGASARKFNSTLINNTGRPKHGIRFFQGALAPNGKIYAIGDIRYASMVIEIDVINESFRTVPPYNYAYKNYGSVILHPNGKLYLLPDTQNLKIGEINLNCQSIIPNMALSPYYNYSSGST
jgi:hypothetical protein